MTIALQNCNEYCTVDYEIWLWRNLLKQPHFETVCYLTHDSKKC